MWGAFQCGESRRAPGTSAGQGRLQLAFPGSEKPGSSVLLTPVPAAQPSLPGCCGPPTPPVLLIALYRYHTNVRWTSYWGLHGSRVCQPTGCHFPAPMQRYLNENISLGRVGWGSQSRSSLISAPVFSATYLSSLSLSEQTSSLLSEWNWLAPGGTGLGFNGVAEPTGAWGTDPRMLGTRSTSHYSRRRECV